MVDMTNIGVAPYDPDTLVGRVRVITGDVVYGTITEGMAEYELFSDAEIESFILEAEESTLRAAGFGYLALAGRASLDAKSIKDYDLSVDLKARSAELRKQAMELFAQADEKDKRDGVSDVFELANTGRPYSAAELAEREYWLWYL
jgi:hypothetical protein